MPRKYLPVVYSLLVGLPVLALLAVLKAGSGLTASSAAAAKKLAAVASPPAAFDLFLLVLQIAVVLFVSRVVGMLFRRIHQPQVVGEMVAGILLGPSLLGWLAPSISHFVFPAPAMGYLNSLSQIGLVLFMFTVGLSLNPKELHGHGHAAVLTSHASIVMPFCLGSGLALFLYPRLATAGVGFVSFALFMGAAMSITAFPVLARILREHKLQDSPMGVLSIACAAVDDVTGWCILAAIVALVRAGHTAMPAWATVLGALASIAVMFLVVKPLLPRLETAVQHGERANDNGFSLMIVLALLSALTTEWLGIHSLFGAFLMGAIMPKGGNFVTQVQHKLEGATVVVLLPLFFAYSGLRTSIGSVTGSAWIYTALIVGVAIAGKFGGSMTAARVAGMSWRDSASLGILMNTRGLMELIALNIGLDIGVISQQMFTMLVMMALITTFMTSPLLDVVYPARLRKPREERASAAAVGGQPLPAV